MDSNKEVILDVRHLKQYFGKADFKAVDDVSFSIYKGEVFGVVGESGCGKTTTGRTIIRLYNATSGDVYFKGKRIVAGMRSYKDAIKQARSDSKARIKEYRKNGQTNKIKEEEAKLDAFVKDQRKQMTQAKLDQKENADLLNEIQMIFQDPIASLNPRMTVREIISEGLRIQGEKDRKLIDERVGEMLETIGLRKEHADRYPHEFSGGQRQRIGIARAVMMKPELIIADEPVSALDVSIQAQVINLLNDLRHEMGLTIMFIAHDLSVVKYFSDRIAVMYFGKIVELADSDELFAHPLHPYTRSLLSAIPLPDPHYEKRRKRITYTPELDHDYSVEGPSLREVTPGHIVSCNTVEFQQYRRVVGAE